MRDPERWLNDPGAPSAMGDLLRAAQSVSPTAAEKAALAAQLGLGATASWSLPFALKALTATCAALGTGALVWSLSGGADWANDPLPSAQPTAMVAQQAEPSISVPAETASDEPALPPAPTGRVAEQTVEQPAQPAPPVGTSARASLPKKASNPKNDARIRNESSAATASIDKPSEARLLAAARSALSTDPQRALQLLNEHRAAYPRGVLAQEREVMRVDALKRAGQQDAAKKAAETFRKEHPDSVHHLDK